MDFDKIKIKAVPQRGFWRCKVFHPPEEVTHPADKFSPEQIEILEAEPKLAVTKIQSEALKAAIAKQEAEDNKVSAASDGSVTIKTEGPVSIDSADGEISLSPDGGTPEPEADQAEGSAGPADQESDGAPEPDDRSIVSAVYAAYVERDDGKKPTVDQVAAKLGRKVTADERDEAWAKLEAEEAAVLEKARAEKDAE